MELEQIFVLVERIGLPGVLLGIMCYYIMKTQQAHREEIIRWEEKDTVGDSRLIDVIKEQNKQNATTAQALNDLNTSNTDVTKRMKDWHLKSREWQKHSCQGEDNG